jgi:hypothetical protein
MIDFAGILPVILKKLDLVGNNRRGSQIDVYERVNTFLQTFEYKPADFYDPNLYIGKLFYI